ncbi:MAG TPA: hypothetical protein VM869_18430 [Enhygromyxa sp.]|nr:hypothetical protein [Enhygromyxa sp.]
MNTLLAKLPAFALPFVTRSLRGGRGKRYVAFSLLIAAATLLMGLWITLGRGTFEQGLRVEFGVEADEWSRQQREFVVFTHDRFELEHAEDEAEHMRRVGPFAEQGQSYSEMTLIRDHGRDLLELAAWSSNTLAPEHLALRDQARALLDPNQTRAWTSYQYFPWTQAAEVAMLERVVARQGIPEVVRYESPLELGDALTIVGFMAGLILAACATVFVPLLVAVQQAQERHENTLTPLTGTSLNPRELALGLASGPAAVVMIFAAPQLVLFGACALLVGDLLVALSLLVALAASGLFLTFAGQLLGHLVGHRRTPGIVAIALMTLLSVSWLLGGGIMSELNHEIAGFAAVMPTIGLSGLLVETFADLSPLRHFETVHLATLAWSVAALVFAGLTLTALAHKIEGRRGAPLSPGAALLGALTCVGLINLALPFDHVKEGVRMYLGLAGLSVPFTILLMARVPIGDEPPRLRRVPVAKLLGEFAGWGAAHVVVAVVMPDFAPHSLHAVALLWIGWCVVTLGLIAIRVVAVPTSILAHLFVGFCGASLIMGYLQAIYWAFERNHRIDDIFAMSEVSPVLGLVQVAVTFGVPLMLLRILRKNLSSLRDF